MQDMYLSFLIKIWLFFFHLGNPFLGGVVQNSSNKFIAQLIKIQIWIGYFLDIQILTSV